MAKFGRSAVSLVLIVVAAVLLVVGGVALYVRQEIVEPEAFADRAAAALREDAVREVVAREIVVQLIDRGTTDLISARPVLESAVGFVVETTPFRKLFRQAALQANRFLFVRDKGNVAFDIADAGTIVVSTLRSVAPDVAKQVPPDFDAELVRVRDRSFATGTLRFADQVRFLGIVLPILAVVLFAVAIAIAPDRRGAVTRVGIAVGSGAATLIVALLLLRAYVVSHVYGGDELTDEEVQDATREILDAFLGDLTTWAFVVGAIALVVAAAASSLLQPFQAGEGFARLRARLAPPESAGGRALHGSVVALVGLLVVIEPTLALQVLAVAFGAVLIYFGVSELLSAIQPRTERAEERARSRLWPALGAGVAVVAIVGFGLSAWLSGGDEEEARAGPVKTCNGYVELCNRRLDQVVFAGTHNSMSAADTRGWLLANQRRTISRQLRDGIRLFLIDPHYGIQDRRGKVRTDFGAEKRGENRVGAKLTPQARAALERLGGSLGVGNFKGGTRDVWLCHSVCELGATKMVDALRDIRRFLDRNPGEVVIIFDEDYVSEEDLDRTYRKAGLHRYLATLNRDEPLPTLRQLIRSGKRVIVLSERVSSGEYEWNHNGFAFVQDTPLGATKPSAFKCDRNRGYSTNALLMINNWIDRFPPPLSANRAVLKRSFIERRARRCARERELRPALIASDFYDQGKLVDAVRELNGLAGKSPAPVR
jgi:Short repeat of unknown function (DUF308)